MFVRISWDQIVDLGEFERVVTSGEIRRDGRHANDVDRPSAN
jgi:hypothetical protein